MRSNAAVVRPPYQIVGRFQCQEALESSPPFLTYRARTQGLAGFERVFAVKVLPADAPATRSDAGQRLLEAAVRANAAKDARLGQVVDSGTLPDGAVYVATEFVFGLNLAGLRNGTLIDAPGQRTPATMLLAHLAAEIAGALAAAHDAKPPLVHGALAPNNIFLTVRGAVKVVDFGQRMAVLPGRAAGAKRQLSAYAAPELLLAGDGSPEADVFALGSMLFEMATGKPPPSARNPRSATDLARSLSVLPAEFAEVVTLLLRADPAKRPTARAAEVALRQSATGLSEPELRAQLAGLARRLTTPASTITSSSESTVMPLPTLPEPKHPRAPTNENLRKTQRARAPSDVDPVRHTAPTTRPPDPAGPAELQARSASARVVSPQPMNTLPFAAVLESGLAGSVPHQASQAGPTAEIAPDLVDVALTAWPGAGEARVLTPVVPEASGPIELELEELQTAQPHARAAATQEAPRPAALRPPKLPVSPVAGPPRVPTKPNMENITTGEMNAIFGPGVMGDASGATAAVPGVLESDLDDFEDAETGAFHRGMFAKLVGNDAETPVRPPPPLELVFPQEADGPASASAPWTLEADAPGGFKSAAAEGTNEVGDDQLLTPGGVDGHAPLGAAATPAYEEPLADEPAADEPDDARAPDEREAGAYLHRALSDDDEFDQPRPAGRRRLVITLATAAVVAALGAVVGGHFLGGKPRRVKQAQAVPTMVVPKAVVVADEPVARPAARQRVTETQANAEPHDEVAPPAHAESKTGGPGVPNGGPAPRDVQGHAHVAFKTQPAGVTLWINGGERGLTPMRTQLKDRHKTLVLIKAGWQHVVEQLDHSTLTAERTYELERAVPPQGAASLRVECQQEGKYPIMVDRKDTGLLCPASLNVSPGEHIVGVYVPWRFKTYENKVVVGAGRTKLTKFAK